MVADTERCNACGGMTYILDKDGIGPCCPAKLPREWNLGQLRILWWPRRSFLSWPHLGHSMAESGWLFWWGPLWLEV